ARARALAPPWVVDSDKGLSRPRARIAHELAGVEARAARDARLTEDQHCLVLGVMDRPGLDGRVDLVKHLNPKLRRRIARVILEILVSDDVEEALPLLVVGAARVDVHVVVMSARLAFEDVGGRISAEHHLVAHSRAGPAVE